MEVGARLPNHMNGRDKANIATICSILGLLTAPIGVLIATKMTTAFPVRSQLVAMSGSRITEWTPQSQYRSSDLQRSWLIGTAYVYNMRQREHMLAFGFTEQSLDIFPIGAEIVGGNTLLAPLI